MSTDYYLIPITWTPKNKDSNDPLNNQVEVIETGKGIELLRNTTPKKARQIALQKEKELNNGCEFSIMTIAEENIKMIEIQCLSYSQVRDYRRFCDWPCNQEEGEFNVYIDMVEGMKIYDMTNPLAKELEQVKKQRDELLEAHKDSIQKLEAFKKSACEQGDDLVVMIINTIKRTLEAAIANCEKGKDDGQTP